MLLDSSIITKATYWATSKAFDNDSKREITTLLEAHNERELADRFYRDLEFGTGGLRGIMGAGSNRMNIYNIRRATTALALQIVESQGRSKSLKVAVSFDSRNRSHEFAKAACEVLAAHNIRTVITKELRPTPMLSFMVRHFGCDAGICVTASHNPPEYNGFKVYWDTGAQVIAPHDKAIIDKYDAFKRYEDLRSMPYDEAVASGLVQEVGGDFDEIYFKKVESLSLRKQGRSGFKIVYTPLHGSGLVPVTACLKRFGFNDVKVVPEQREPDGNFPTVKFPNPEDPAALKMALDLAKIEQADLVLGTDPDGDRIGIVVREKDTWTFFNGNQLGCLLVDYYLDGMKANNRMPENPLVIKTIVTTDLQRDIAMYYGADCEETLTGFKWICGLIEDYETGRRKPRKHYVCGGEESYGFLADSFVRDKDAVSACCLASEMVAYHKSRGQTCSEVLEAIFQRHGLYQESLFTITLPGKDGAEAIKSMMTSLRQNPPKAIDGISTEILQDFLNGQISRFTSGRVNPAGTLTLPPSDVLQFILTDGTKVSVRPSGTEPKIKFYVSIKDLAAKGAQTSQVRILQASAIKKLTRIEQEFVKLAKG